jgi:hypothetical protein
MASALRTRQREAGGIFSVGDDNETDARWLLCYALAVDDGTQNWKFGWQLKQEKRAATKANRARRRLQQKERLNAVRADGLNRLDTIVSELGEKMPPRAARKAVIDLCRSKRHTLELSSHVIVGSVLKNGELRWQLSLGGPHPHEIFPPKGGVSGSRKLVPAANHQNPKNQESEK